MKSGIGHPPAQRLQPRARATTPACAGDLISNLILRNQHPPSPAWERGQGGEGSRHGDAEWQKTYPRKEVGGMAWRTATWPGIAPESNRRSARP